MPGASASEPAIRDKTQTLEATAGDGSPSDRTVAELAGRQHGVVSREQLLTIGVARSAIGRRVDAGRLHVVHRGVYAVGHTAITQRGRWMAAVLASGDGAVLSHRSATALWRIWGSGAGEAHVTVPRKTRSQRSIRRHFAVLPRDEITVRDGIPVTSAARAVLDLAGDKGQAAAEAALREMEYLGVYGEVSLPGLIHRHPHHRGAPIVRVCLGRLRDDPGGRIRSPLEELFLPFLDSHGVPRPLLNAWITVGDDRFEVDCLWPGPHLIGELDGFQSHGTRRAFHKDRHRDCRLLTSSYRVVRITRDQLATEPSALAADLHRLLVLPTTSK